jgi:hypothetical protein
MKNDVDWRAVSKLPRPERARAIAIFLSPHADKAGVLSGTPYTILCDSLKNNTRSGRAKGIVNLLKEEGWLRNDESRAGYIGEWHLDVKRLGEVHDTTLQIELLQVATDLTSHYRPDGIRALIALLQERLPR